MGQGLRAHRRERKLAPTCEAAARDRSPGATPCSFQILHSGFRPFNSADRGHGLPADRAHESVPRGRGDFLGGAGRMKVKFWGTRGSVASPGRSTARYGGNTSCVEVVGKDGTR